MWTIPAISRLVVLPACLALALAPAVALTGCDPNADESGISYTAQGGTSDQDRVSAEVGDLMDTLRDPASHDLSAVIARLDNNQRLAIDLVQSHGIDLDDLCAHLFATSSYSLGDISIEGDTATVGLTMSHKPFGRVANQANAEFAQLMGTSDGQALLAQGVDALLARYEQTYLADLDASDDMVNDEVDLTLTKVNGAWSLDSSSLEELAGKLVEGVELPVSL